MNVIETKRLLLKTAYTERDGEAFLRMMKEEGACQSLFGIPLSDDIEEKLYHYFDTDDCLFAIFEKAADAEMIGYIGVSYRNGSYEVEFYLSKPFRNRGYCTEALVLLVDLYFEGKLALTEDKEHPEELNFLYGSFLTENKATQRVLEKCGFGKNPQREILNELFYNPKTEEVISMSMRELAITKERWARERSGNGWHENVVKKE